MLFAKTNIVAKHHNSDSVLTRRYIRHPLFSQRHPASPQRTWDDATAPLSHTYIRATQWTIGRTPSMNVTYGEHAKQWTLTRQRWAYGTFISLAYIRHPRWTIAPGFKRLVEPCDDKLDAPHFVRACASVSTYHLFVKISLGICYCAIMFRVLDR